jgi:hypothetical protein
MLIANIANKTCPFSTVVGMNTHIQQKVEKCQVNNISGTPELDELHNPKAILYRCQPLVGAISNSDEQMISFICDN